MRLEHLLSGWDLYRLAFSAWCVAPAAWTVREVSLLVLSSLFCNIKINKEDKVGGLRLWFKSIVFTHHVAPFTTLHLWYRSLTC